MNLREYVQSKKKETAQPTQPTTTQQPTGPIGTPTGSDMTYLMQKMSQTQNVDPVQRFNQIQGYIPEPQRGKTISQEQARAESHQQIQPLYQQALNQNLGRIENDAIKRGFFGQLPTEGIKARAANQSAVSLANAVNMSANDMVQRSNAMATEQHRYDTGRRDQQVNMLSQMVQQRDQQVQQGFQNIMTMIQYQAGREDAAWQRQQTEFANKMQEAALTGMYNGNMTADMQKFYEGLGFQREQLDYQKEIDAARLAAQRAGSGSASKPLDVPSLNQIKAMAWAETQSAMGNKTWQDFMEYDDFGTPLTTQAEAERMRSAEESRIEAGYVRYYTMLHYDVDPHDQGLYAPNPVQQQGAIPVTPGETSRPAVPKLASDLPKTNNVTPAKQDNTLTNLLRSLRN